MFKKRLGLRLLLVITAISFFACCIYVYLGVLTGLKVENSAMAYKLEPGEVVIVTSYFNIGSFAKGSKSVIFTPNTYKNWMKKYSKIYSPVIAYFDDEKYAETFRKVRSKIPSYFTKVFIISRETLWGFQILPRIKKIYDNPAYPKHLPNTVIPAYSCAMHAKYDLVEKVINAKYYGAEYYAWVDMGLWRQLDEKAKPFKLLIPETFNRSKVAYSEVYRDKEKNISLKEIIYKNMVWVGGASFLGTQNTLQKMVDYYRHTVDVLLKMGLMDTDQQIIYAMHSKKWPEKLPINIQTYTHNATIGPDEWFFLAYLCRWTWMNKHPKANFNESNFLYLKT